MTHGIPEHLSFLGCGSMNSAILLGLLAGGLDPAHAKATVRSVERARQLRSSLGVEVLATSETPEANQQVAAGADVVILGVKPAGIVDLAREIATVLRPGTLVLSVAAAVTIEMIEEVLPAEQPVIRTMPNTPSSLGRGVLSMSAGTHADTGQMDRARRILSPAGTVVEIPESQVDALSAVSGSGPAYVFYLAEAMTAAGIELGLDPSLAKLLAAKTVAGAGLMLAADGADAAALRRAVTSPNGTTETAIAAFDEQGLPAVVAAGARAAAERAAAITAELRG